MEVRCRIAQSLHTVLSPHATAPYLLDQAVDEPDPEVLALNAELVAFDETAARLLREREAAFVRDGLALLAGAFLVANAPMVAPINANGCGRMRLNILVLQQNLRNIEAAPRFAGAGGGAADLRRAARYFELFALGPDEIVRKAKEDSEAARTPPPATENGEGAGAASTATAPAPAPVAAAATDRFTYDELKALLELCYSEQLADPERGVAAAAKRQMADKLLALSEYMWQS